MNDNKVKNQNPSSQLLIADDNEEMRLYLRHILQREGYEIIEAVNGTEALDACREQQVDIILLDAVMPEMDGFAACQAIRLLPGYERIPVIMLTALDDSKSLDLAFESGASEYITKPVHWNFLVQRIGYMLESFQAEERIRRSEEMLAEAQRIAHLGNWDWNITANTLVWSDEIYRIFGLSPQEFGATYEAFLERVHPDDREFITESVNRALEKDAPYSIDHRIVLGDGTEKVVHEQGEVYRDDSGQPVRMLGVVHDITKRTLAEKEVRENGAKLKSILDTAVEGIITINEQGIIQSFNHAAEEIFGYTAEEVVGSNITMLQPEPYCSHHDQYLQNYLETSVKKIIGIGREVEGKRKDGTTFPMELSVSEVQVEDGRLFTGIVRDITERKMYETKLQEYSDSLEETVRQRTDELEQEKRKVEDASRSKSEFLANMTHELKTPLNAILGFADILLNISKDGLTDEQREYLGDIADSGRHLLAMIQEMLVVAQLDNKDAADNESFDLEEMLRDCLRASKEKHAKPGMEDVLSMDVSIGTIRADENKIRQVVTNLLDNAFKFSLDGAGVHLSAERRNDEAGTWLEITVADTGPGIDAKDHDRIFRPFEQLDGSYTRQFGGLGLGLFKVKKIIDLLDGRIEVESSIGQGSRFTVLLPLEEDASDRG